MSSIFDFVRYLIEQKSNRRQETETGELQIGLCFYKEWF